VEKPDAVRAAQLHAAGRHLWSCGMFVLPARSLLEAMRRFQPAILEAAERVASGDTPGPAPRLSLDRAVLEPGARAGLCGLVPLRYERLDAGRLAALAELLQRDGADNAAAGDVLALDTSRCMLVSDGATLAALGLQDLVVIVERDVVMVCPRRRAGEVRLTNELRNRRRDDLL
jgi:mannose-1-phosphate guanylyltransferase/mannose-1-phosphate guanylyltransferase/mannose-6-phosphate isomerase